MWVITQANRPSSYNGADQLCWTSTTRAGACATQPNGDTTHAYDLTGNRTIDKSSPR